MGGTVVLREEPPFGWRWSWSPECRGSPTTREPTEGLREVLAPVDSGCNREGRQRGNGERGEAVPDREREVAKEACTTRSTVTRSGGARARSRAWAALGMNGWPSGAIWSGRERVVARAGLGNALYRRAAVHRGLVRQRARARRYGPRVGAVPSLGHLWGWTTPRGEERERGTR